MTVSISPNSERNHSYFLFPIPAFVNPDEREHILVIESGHVPWPVPQIIVSQLIPLPSIQKVIPPLYQTSRFGVREYDKTRNFQNVSPLTSIVINWLIDSETMLWSATDKTFSKFRNGGFGRSIVGDKDKPIPRISVYSGKNMK